MQVYIFLTFVFNCNLLANDFSYIFQYLSYNHYTSNNINFFVYNLFFKV